MTEFKTLKEISNKLSHADYGMGTEHLYFRTIESSVYTDGFKKFMELGEAQWLYSDIIEIELYPVLKKLDTPDKYYLTIVVKDSEATITLRDYRDNIIHKRDLPFTTLPEGEILFYVAWMEYHNPSGEGLLHRMTTCLPIED